MGDKILIKSRFVIYAFLYLSVNMICLPVYSVVTPNKMQGFSEKIVKDSLIYSVQSIPDIFNIVFDHDWENDPLGYYTRAQFTKDFQNGLYEWGMGDRTDVYDPRSCEIIDNTDYTNSSKVLRSHFPKGKYGTSSGFCLEGELKGNYDELYLTYNIRFKEGFNFVDGGKLPGLSGGNIVVPNPPTGEQGFVCGEMWGWDGSIRCYIYHHDQTSIYGEGGIWNSAPIVPGEWTNITIRVVMNDVGQANGIYEGFVNGKLAFTKSNYRFRMSSAVATHKIELHSFFGGDGQQYAAKRDEYIDFDQFYVFTYNENVDVPRGREVSASDRTLILPNYLFDDIQWKNSLEGSALSSRSVSLNWDSYPVKTNYQIQRKQVGGEFLTIATLAPGSTSYLDKNLTPSTIYTYRLLSNDVYSEVVQVQTFDPLPPTSPNQLQVRNVSKRQLEIYWMDRSFNELGFTIERSVEDSLNFSEIGSVNSGNVSYTDLGLAPNTYYYYRVRANNEDGVSGFSNTLQVKTLPLSPPLSPSALLGSQITENAALLTWKDNSANETGFQIEKSNDPIDGFTNVGTTNSNVNTYNVLNLQNSSKYFFRLRSFNEDGSSLYSNVIEITTLAPQPPAPPSLLTASGITKYSITVNWKDNSGNETGFQLEYSLNPSTGFTLLSQTNSNSAIYIHNNLTPNIKYYYRIRAVNAIGTSDYTGVIEVTTLSLSPPVAPSNLFVSNISTNAVILTWKDNSINESGFQIERSLTSGNGFVLASSLGPNSTTYNNGGLMPKTKYFYRIRTFNEDGTSVYSPEISVLTLPIPLPEAPTNLQALNNDSAQVLLLWDDIAKNEKGYQLARSLNKDSGFIVIGTLDMNVTKYIDIVDPDEKYYYKVRAFNESGNSNYSNNVDVFVLGRADRRYWSNLIVFYDFSRSFNTMVHDISGYKVPLPLIVKDTKYTTQQSDGGVELSNGAILKSQNIATKIIDACKSTNEVAIETWIKGKYESSPFNSTIYALEKSPLIRNFALENSFDDVTGGANFSLANTTAVSVQNGLPYLSARSNSYAAGNLNQIVYTRNKEGLEKLFINGEMVKNSYRVGNYSYWNTLSYLILGNNISESSSWEGRLFLFALYNASLNDSIIKKHYSLELAVNPAPLNSAIDVNCYPNPTYGNTTIEISSSKSNVVLQDIVIQIYNSNGLIIHENKLFRINNTYKYEYNFLNNIPGLYYIKVSSYSNSVSKKVIVLNNSSLKIEN